MKLDFKKMITKTVPGLALALMLLLTGTGVMGCGDASAEPEEQTQQQEQAEESKDKVLEDGTVVFDEPVMAIQKHKDGTITIYDQKVDTNHYYLVQENTLWEVEFEADNINFNPLIDLEDAQVKELEKLSVGQYVDHTKIEEEIVLDNEFIFIKDGQMIAANTALNDGQPLVSPVPEEYKEELTEALTGFVIDINRVVFEEVK